MKHTLRLALTAIFTLLTGTAAAEVTLIHVGELLAVPGEPPAREMTVIVEGDRITGVQKGYVETEGATTIDLRDKFVLPGLMDMHVHLQGQLGPDNDRDALKMSSQLMQMRSLHYAMTTLLAGFTTVRDVGSSEQEMYAMRDAIDAVDVIGRHVTLRKKGSTYSGLCPFHREKTPSFVVWADSKIWKCFGCGKAGNVFGFVTEREGLTFREAVLQLGREAGRGLGFGLSKCWRIVTDHGGRIEVESQPGQGATFVITLPSE